MHKIKAVPLVNHDVMDCISACESSSFVAQDYSHTKFDERCEWCEKNQCFVLKRRFKVYISGWFIYPYPGQEVSYKIFVGIAGGLN